MNNMKDLIALFDNHKIYDTDIWTNVLILLVFTDLVFTTDYYSIFYR